MLVRYFAAAGAAAGVEEERHDLPEGTTLEGLIVALLALDRSERPADAPSLPAVISRSSFLCNEIAVRDRALVLRPDDVIDVLPPFAGG